MSSEKLIARNSAVITAIMAISAILGIGRESAIAFMFGASVTTDAFLVASVMPALVTGMISGSITSSFIVVYNGFLARGEVERAWRFTNIVLSVFTLALMSVVTVLLLYTSFFVHVLAPHYTDYSLSLTVELTRMLLPNIIWGGLLGLFIGINNSHNSFFAPAAIGLVSNVIILICIFTVGKVYGIYGLAAGTLIGVLCQFLMQIPSSRASGLKFRLIFDFKDEGLKEMVVLLGPFIISATAGQINLIVDRTLATGLPNGTVSALYFADKLAFLPSLFTGAVGTVVFPSLVRAASVKDWDQLGRSICEAFRLLFVVLVPAVIGIYVLRVPLLQLLFERGAFVHQHTMLTSTIVPFYLGSLLCGAIATVFINVFYSFKMTVIPVATGVLSVAANIGISLSLIDSYQHLGLAAANFMSAFVNLCLLTASSVLILKLHKKIALSYRGAFAHVFKIWCAAVFMGIVVAVFYYRVLPELIQKEMSFIAVISAVALGISSYIIFAYMLNVEEVKKGVIWTKVKVGSLSGLLNKI